MACLPETGQDEKKMGKQRQNVDHGAGLGQDFLQEY